jgi:cation transport protein ChaC
MREEGGDEGLWIFGYGSLVWRPAFPHRQRRAAWVRGFRRRFWQGSTDHRGVPGAPGRVVTLVREADARCWGMAYEVAAPEVEEVIALLDHREKGGYERVEAELHLADESAATRQRRGLLYLATAGNPNYLGPAPLAEIAGQVRAARGPSGHNVEYVLRLAEALLEMQPGLEAAGEETLALAALLEVQRETDP